jgi:protease II
MLVKVSINDSQVPYWEGAKLVARLRATKTDSNPLLLKVNFGAGARRLVRPLRHALHETAFKLGVRVVADGRAVVVSGL